MSTALRIALPALLTSFCLIPLQLVADSGIDKQQLQEARTVVKTFAKNLQAALKPAMKTGGPLNAIEICHHQASAITQATAKQSAWQIGRTSLKTRSSANNPDRWELKVLLAFEQRLMAGEDVQQLDHFELVKDKDKGKPAMLRYMKAIPTGDLCLKCHGSQIDGKVLKKLQQLYPQDRATGFKAGEIRGAFTLQKPLPQ